MFIKLNKNGQTSRLLGFPRSGSHKYPLAKTKFIEQMKAARNKVYNTAYHKAIIDAEKVVLGLGDDEIDTSTLPEVVIEEKVVDIPMLAIGDLPARTIKVIMAPQKHALEVLVNVDQLTYLAEALRYHIMHIDAMDAAAPDIGEKDDGEIVSDKSADEDTAADGHEDAD